MCSLIRQPCEAALRFAGVIAYLVLSAHAAQQGRASLERMAQASEESCVATLRVINVAQVTYRGGDWAKGYARTLKELGPAGVNYLDSVTVSGKKGDYRFNFIPERVKPHHPNEHYAITARPTKRLVKDQKSYFTDETGVIRFTVENRAATKTDLPIDNK